MFIFGVAYSCKLQPVKQHFMTPIMSAVSFSYIYPIHRNRTETQTKISKIITCRAVLEHQAMPALHSFTALRYRISHQPVAAAKNWLGSHAHRPVSITFIIHVFLTQASTPMRANPGIHLTPLTLIKHHVLSLLKHFEDRHTEVVSKLEVCVGPCFQHDAIVVYYLLE